MARLNASPRIKPVVVMAIVLIAIACASGSGKSARRTDCDLLDRDSVFVLSGPAYRDCGVDRVARRLSSDIHPDFSPTARRSACYAADLEFVVDSAGVPETRTARIVRATDQTFAEAVVATLGRWKYDPAVRDQRRVRQIVTAHEMVATRVVVVPAGAPVPSSPPRQRPSC